MDASRNAALAMGKDIEYVKVGVKTESSDVETYILAKALVGKYFKEGEYGIIEKVDPKELVGKYYEPLFDFYCRESR